MKNLVKMTKNVKNNTKGSENRPPALPHCSVEAAEKCNDYPLSNKSMNARRIFWTSVEQTAVEWMKAEKFEDLIKWLSNMDGLGPTLDPIILSNYESLKPDGLSQVQYKMFCQYSTWHCTTLLIWDRKRDKMITIRPPHVSHKTRPGASPGCWIRMQVMGQDWRFLGHDSVDFDEPHYSLHLANYIVDYAHVFNISLERSQHKEKIARLEGELEKLDLKNKDLESVILKKEAIIEDQIEKNAQITKEKINADKALIEVQRNLKDAQKEKVMAHDALIKAQTDIIHELFAKK
eukprot:GHVL01011688.1.p1 GENE.GHVL01011688.1~~GHVL01011688.1.p1  ORF type:complete len:291 (+),score=44.93 GHVL01011688.1:42-914(+)